MRTFPLLISLLLTKPVFAQIQPFHQQFQDLVRFKDTGKMGPFIAFWEQKSPTDPELFVSAFNYYFLRAKKEIVQMTPAPEGTGSLEIRDSTGKIAGYMSSKLYYDPVLLDSGYRYINRGISLYPDRLDMRFGKIYVLGQAQAWDSFTTNIIRTVEYSRVNKNRWQWAEGKPLKDAERSMLQSVQAYLKQLYDTEDNSLLGKIQQIGEVVFKYYSSNIELLSTVGVTWLLTGQYDKGLQYLKMAEKLNPKDFVVVNNLAYGYKLKGDKKNALKYYQLVYDKGNKEAKEQAAAAIRELKAGH